MNQITAAFQLQYSPGWLSAFKRFSGNDSADSDDFFSFITTPTAQREEFIVLYCNTGYAIANNVLVQTLTLNT